MKFHIMVLLDMVLLWRDIEIITIIFYHYTLHTGEKKTSIFIGEIIGLSFNPFSMDYIILCHQNVSHMANDVLSCREILPYIHTVHSSYYIYAL